MPIDVSCPRCGHGYSVKDDAAGRRFKCKHCGDAIDVPGATLTEASPPESRGFELASDADRREPTDDALLPASGRRGRRASSATPSSRLGKASLIIGCIVWVLVAIGFVVMMVVGFSAAQHMQQNGQQPPNEETLATYGFIGIAACGTGCVAYILALVGGILGLIAISQPSESKGQAIGGIVLNGLYFIGATGLIVLSMIAANADR